MNSLGGIKVLNAVPSYCCISFTESCFMKCKMCHIWNNKVNLNSEPELNIDQWKCFLNDFSAMHRTKPRINFTGGEPLVRKEVLALIEYASSLGLDSLLATNAYLIDDQIAQNINKSRLKVISISLDAVNSDTHDFLRGVNGSFERVLRAIDLLSIQAKDTEINLCCVISAVNLKEIVKLVKWANQDERIKGIGFQAITQPFNTQEIEQWYANPEYSFLWPQDIEFTESVMDELIEIKRSNSLRDGFMIQNPVRQFEIFKKYFKNPEDFIKKDRCYLSQQAINIGRDGQVHICFQKPTIGNIKNTAIKDIWFSEKANIVRQQITTCRKNCQSIVNCNFDEAADYIK